MHLLLCRGCVVGDGVGCCCCWYDYCCRVVVQPLLLLLVMAVACAVVWVVFLFVGVRVVAGEVVAIISLCG